MVIASNFHCLIPAAASLASLRAQSVTAWWGPRQSRSAKALHRAPWSRLRCAPPQASRVPRSHMASNSSGQGKDTPQSGDITDVQARIQAVISDSSVDNRWDQLWKEGVTPWDVGTVTPVIQDLIDKGDLPDGRALVPGCGAGYDVFALASEKRHAVGLDISETVVKAALKKAAEDSKGRWVEFSVADFFDYAPEARFDLIFDYTFFCAIDPSLRPAWAAKIADLLTQDGELITLMFPLGEFDNGPPFAVSIESYEKELNPHGFTMTSCKDNELAIGSRKGREKIARWTRKITSSKF
ncbi:unnamed protein product [Calypogeia fissa]